MSLTRIIASSREKKDKDKEEKDKQATL